MRWGVPAVFGVVLGTCASVLPPLAPAVSLPPGLASGPSATAPAGPAATPSTTVSTKGAAKGAATGSTASAAGSGTATSPGPKRTTGTTPDASPSTTTSSAPSAPAGAGRCPTPKRGVVTTSHGAARTVALTFDDGPDAQTAAVLDVLARQDVHATFFVIGEHADVRPELVRRAVDEGHLVGNHTWDHTYPRDVRGGWTRPYLDDSLGRTSSAVTRASGAPVCWFRPPGGFLPSTVVPAARSLRMTTAVWSVDSLDWKVQATPARTASARRTQVDEVVANATAATGQQHPVVLLHDGGGDREVTVEALPRIIDWYRTHGYTFVRLDGKA